MKMLRSSFCLIVGLIAISLSTEKASATLVTYNFSGLMNENFSLSPSTVFGTVPLNAPFTSTLTYDDSQPTPNGATSEASYSLTSISVTIGSETATGTGGSLIVYDKAGGYVDDFIEAYSNSITGTLGGINPTALEVGLQNVNGGVLSGPAIPGPGLTFSDFTPGSPTFVELDDFNFPTNLFARGEIGASVPEPASLTLVLLAYVAASARRSRREHTGLLGK
jgi:hypothetical protein